MAPREMPGTAPAGNCKSPLSSRRCACCQPERRQLQAAILCLDLALLLGWQWEVAAPPADGEAVGRGGSRDDESALPVGAAWMETYEGPTASKMPLTDPGPGPPLPAGDTNH